MSDILQCSYCKRLLDKADAKTKLAKTMDHVQPASSGGTVLVPCCIFCNNLKADLTAHDWFWFINAYPSYWKNFTSFAQVRKLCRLRPGRWIGAAIQAPAGEGVA